MKNAKLSALSFITAGLILTAGYAFAQQADHGHMSDMKSDHMMGMNSSAQEGYEAANARMHKDMMVTYSGNADTDFLRSMIPHHQGAIDMGQVVLKFGKDPEVLRMAEQIVKVQQEEIATMQKMIARLEKQ